MEEKFYSKKQTMGQSRSKIKCF